MVVSDCIKKIVSGFSGRMRLCRFRGLEALVDIYLRLKSKMASVGVLVRKPYKL